MILSLADAKKRGKIQEFVAQQESRCVGPIAVKAFDAIVKEAAMQPQSQDQTSGSRARGGSSGKKIP